MSLSEYLTLSLHVVVVSAATVETQGRKTKAENSRDNVMNEITCDTPTAFS